MSYSLRTNIWLGSRDIDFGLLFTRMAECIDILISDASAGYYVVRELGGQSPVQGELEPDTEFIKNLVTSYWSAQSLIEMRFLTNLAQPLALSLYGIGDDWRDSRSRPGNFEIAFDNVNDFRTDYTSATFDISKRSNFELHVEVISKIAKRLDPDHMFTTTGDTDVGPLVAHQVYHRRIKDFASDLVVSAHLHNTGEFDYSQQADHRHRDHPWRESWENYGYLRREKGRKYLEKFIHRVDEISETILKSPSMVDIGESAILSTVLDQKDVYVELVGNGVLLSVSNSPTKYLDATYFALYDRILGNNSSG